MVDVRIKLAALWVAVMLTYLLGDVLRIFSGDFKPGEMGGVQMTGRVWLAAAILMLIPILMPLFTLTLNQPLTRWANIVVAIFYAGFNLIGLPGYPGAYDKFLIGVSIVLNALTIWFAWKWV